jgi:hypothetical protein
MVLRRQLALSYFEKVKSGIYTAMDRTSGRLLSGGDSQMAYEALKLGFRVGLTDRLMLRHLTLSEKLNSNYIRKMYFGCTSNHIVHCEAIPEYKNDILSVPVRNIPWRVVMKIHELGWRVVRIGKYKHFIAFLGDCKGRLDVRGEKSYFLEFLIRILGLV